MHELISKEGGKKATVEQTFSKISFGCLPIACFEALRLLLQYFMFCNKLNKKNSLSLFLSLSLSRD
jgi:hypothetical protein